MEEVELCRLQVNTAAHTGPRPRHKPRTRQGRAGESSALRLGAVTDRATRTQEGGDFTSASSFPKESFWLAFRPIIIHTHIRIINRTNPLKKSPCTSASDPGEQGPFEQALREVVSNLESSWQLTGRFSPLRNSGSKMQVQ